jgi:hypothetical protein
VASEAIYSPAIAAVKFSILLLYKRLFPVGRFHVVCHIMMGFTMAWAITALLIPVLQCVPLEAMWNPLVPGTCINISAALVTMGALNAVTDVIILAMPIPYIWNLHTSKSQKLQLLGVFLTGGL